ncbi:DciA family protein [Marinitoga sp. 1197]|uniref:DciA family protein n=1 Tax=Marinitoga sp. 1197 TaxID=1428449 RepID=UPI000A07BECC|nr:DciA family protein [Marinitoga sp. 1197]
MKMKDFNELFKELSNKNNILKKVLLIKDLKLIVQKVFEKHGLTSVEVVNVDLKTSTLFLYVDNNYIKQEIIFKKKKILEDINNILEQDKIKNLKFSGGVNQ